MNDETCTGNCPICGSPVKSADEFTLEKALGARSRKPAAHWLFEDIDVGQLRDETRGKGEAKLLPGEPAQVILELRERLGASALEGSDFTVKPDALAKLIRALDREAQQEEQTLPDYPPTLEPLPAAPIENAENHEAIVSALRLASRQLDEAAEVLEQQNLFERADELREQADRLRRDARAFLQEQLVPQPAAASFEQTSAPVLNEEESAQVSAATRVQRTYTGVLQSSLKLPIAVDSETALNSECVDRVELFLGELGRIRQAIDQMVKPRKGFFFLPHYQLPSNETSQRLKPSS